MKRFEGSRTTEVSGETSWNIKSPVLDVSDGENERVTEQIGAVLRRAKLLDPPLENPLLILPEAQNISPDAFLEKDFTGPWDIDQLEEFLDRGIGTESDWAKRLSQNWIISELDYLRG